MARLAFAEFIAENLLSTADLSWNVSNNPLLAHFPVENVRVEVTFEERAREEWTVAFEVLTPTTNAYFAFYVFNGVFQAVEEFIAVRSPNKLVFVAKRDDIAAVYETYLRREKERIEALGYTELSAQRVPPFSEYVLQRVDHSNWIDRDA